MNSQLWGCNPFLENPRTEPDPVATARGEVTVLRNLDLPFPALPTWWLIQKQSKKIESLSFYKLKCFQILPTEFCEKKKKNLHFMHTDIYSFHSGAFRIRFRWCWSCARWLPCASLLVSQSLTVCFSLPGCPQSFVCLCKQVVFFVFFLTKFVYSLLQTVFDFCCANMLILL